MTVHLISKVFVFQAFGETFLSSSGITLVNQPLADWRKDRRKEEGSRRQVRWRVTNPNYPEWQGKCAILVQRRVRQDHLSTGCFMHAAIAHLPVTEPMTGRRWPFFSLIGQNNRGKSASGLSSSTLPVEHDFKYHRTGRTWFNQICSKRLYAAADKCDIQQQND